MAENNKTKAVVKKPATKKPATKKNGRSGLPAKQQDLSLMQIMEKSLTDKNVPAEKVRIIYDMIKDMDAENARKAYFQAYAQFQQICPIIYKNGHAKIKTKSGGIIEYDHARFNDILEAIKPFLKQCNLTVSFPSEIKDGRIYISCEIKHVLGHSEKFTLSGPPDESGSKNNLQAIGSTSKYLRRYTLEQALGLYFMDKDDDGSDYSGSEIKQPKPLTEAQKHKLADFMIAFEIDWDKFLKFFKVNSESELTQDHWPRIDKIIKDRTNKDK